jgi:DNA-directed RNA polymerase sigma subunit (sigma70/sigma32)
MTVIGLEPEASYEEIAKKLGVSRVRVMQIEKGALEKLRRLVGAEAELDKKFKVVRRCSG